MNYQEEYEGTLERDNKKLRKEKRALQEDVMNLRVKVAKLKAVLACSRAEVAELKQQAAAHHRKFWDEIGKIESNYVWLVMDADGVACVASSEEAADEFIDLSEAPESYSTQQHYVIDRKQGAN